MNVSVARRLFAPVMGVCIGLSHLDAQTPGLPLVATENVLEGPVIAINLEGAYSHGTIARGFVRAARTAFELDRVRLDAAYSRTHSAEIKRQDAHGFAIGAGVSLRAPSHRLVQPNIRVQVAAEFQRSALPDGRAVRQTDLPISAGLAQHVKVPRILNAALWAAPELVFRRRAYGSGPGTWTTGLGYTIGIEAYLSESPAFLRGFGLRVANQLIRMDKRTLPKRELTTSVALTWRWFRGY